MIHALEIQLSQIGFAQVAKRIRICDKEMLICHYEKHCASACTELTHLSGYPLKLWKHFC